MEKEADAAASNSAAQLQLDSFIEQAESRLRQQQRELAASRFYVGLGIFLAAKAMGRYEDH